MYSKILLIVILIILSVFFYLHAQNPGTVTFVVTKDHTYALPAALILFFGFFGGALFAVLNSLVIDARRALRDIRARKDRKLAAQADESYHKGVEALVKGDTAQARTFIEKAIKARPGDTGLVISLSDTYIRENRPKEALKVLEGGMSMNPGSVNILTAVGRCSLESGDVFRASKAFEEVVSQDARNPYALKKLRDIRIKELAWIEAARLQRNLLECELDDEIRHREKNLLTGLLYEAAARYLDDGRLNEAMGKVKEVLKNDPAFMPAHILIGEILYKAGNSRNAIKVWERAYSKQPDALPLFLRIEDAYLKESEPDRILDRYKRSLAINPNDINLRLLLSRLYLRLEMVDNAIEELERLHHEGEDSFYTRVLLGEAYLRRKQGGKAAQLFQKALGLDRELLPPFVCRSCNGSFGSWAPRCPACGQWNSQAMNDTTAVKSIQAPGRPR